MASKITSAILLFTVFTLLFIPTQAQDSLVLKKLARLQSKSFEIKGGSGAPSSWNVSVAWIFPDEGFRLGAIVQGPHKSFTASDEYPKPEVTTWSITAGWGITKQYLPLRGTSIELFAGSGKNDIANENLPWNFGYQFQIVPTIFSCKSGAYSIALFGQLRRLCLVTNSDKQGVTYETKQKGNWVINYGIAVYL